MAETIDDRVRAMCIEARKAARRVAPKSREVKDAALNFAFKTPTLRSVALRAPYMHNASVATLADVVRHYEKGGIDRPSRSPMMLPVQLTDQERLDLVAFMETLTGAGEGARPNR